MTDDEKLDHSKMVKGKYHDKTPSELAELDPAYLIWAYGAWRPRPCSAMLYNECVKDLAEEERQYHVSRDQSTEGE